jgi:RNA polymerase sigma factor (sigma-70 family)
MSTIRESRSPLTPAQQALAARYLPMARAMAKPLKAAWPVAWDEFESAACLALVEAAEAFEPERNVRFSTFARHRIWGALRDVQRGLVPLGWRADCGRAPAMVHLTPTCERRGTVLGIEPDSDVGCDLEAIDSLERRLKSLPAKHAAACRQIYLHGQTQGEAAEVLGCSQSRLSYLHREALAMLNGSWQAAARSAG